jgi:hypothetical protein
MASHHQSALKETVLGVFVASTQGFLNMNWEALGLLGIMISAFRDNETI